MKVDLEMTFKIKFKVTIIWPLWNLTTFVWNIFHENLIPSRYSGVAGLSEHPVYKIQIPLTDWSLYLKNNKA